MERPPPDASRTRSLAGADEPVADGRSYLLLVEGESSSVFPLPANGVVLFGRAPDVDLTLSGHAVSRRHARLILTEEEVRIVDLDSHNGTRVNGEAIRGARALASGDVISIGEHTMVLRCPPQRARGRALLDVARFRERLGEEIERALEYGSALAMAAVPGWPADEALPDGAVRAIDTVARGDGELLVLMPESSREDAAEAARRLVEALGGARRAGVATCPDEGCDADALMGAAREAAAGATAGDVGDAGRSPTRLALGERTIVVAEPAIRRLYELIRRLAASELPVLICGETGVGKENAAFAVHFWSRRRDRPFVVLNCAAIQETLVESELFGHEKGAFTGATAAKPGLFEAAEGGTVFLDELGELSPAVQAKLLRAVETRRITRVGGLQERAVDIRVVAATNRDLVEEVRAGRFREDLYFRMGAARVMLPPLRERPREIPVLARTFLEDACARAGRPEMAIAPATMRRLARYRWPGNVRELRNAMEYAAAAHADEILEPWQLPDPIGTPAEPPPARPAPARRRPPAEPERSARPLADELRDLERRRIEEALDATGGVRVRAAELLGMPVRTLTWKLRHLGIGDRR